MASYKRLAGGQIRLVQIFDHLEGPSGSRLICGLQPHFLDHAVRYTALSYTWRDPMARNSGDIPDVLIDGTPMEVGSNLASALAQLYRCGHRSIWADAICINQADLDERSQQVLLMRRIYEAASEVFVWLGRPLVGTELETDLTNVAFDFLESVLETFGLFQGEPDLSCIRHIAALCSSLQFSTSYDVVLLALQKMLQLDYWQRAWILQEVSVNDDVTISWGTRSMHWRHFRSAIIYLTVHMRYPALRDFVRDVEEGFSVGEDRTPASAFERIRILETLHGYRQRDLVYNLAIARDTRQTDPRDAVYAKLGLSSDGALVMPCPRYDVAVTESFQTFAQSHIEKTHSLYIMCMSYPDLTSLGLPSWVPDWTTPAPSKQLLGEVRPDSYALVPRATGDTLPQVRFRKHDDAIEAAGFKLAGLWTQASLDGSMDDPSWAQKVVDSFFRTVTAAHYVANDTYDAFEYREGFEPRLAERSSLLIRNPNLFSETSEPGTASIMGNFEAWFAESRNVVLGPLTLDQWLLRYMDSHVSVAEYSFERMPSPWSTLADNFVRSTQVMGAGRKVLMLTSGMLGLVPERAVVNDVVCLLLGCPVPVLLRPVRDGWAVVGECYIDGIMHGQALEAFRDKAGQIETFVIR